MVSGLGNAETLIGLIESGEEHFDFVEIMACPTGCIGGAGQPESFLEDKKKRSSGLYTADKSALVKRSDENPVVTKLYEDGRKASWRTRKNAPPDSTPPTRAPWSSAPTKTRW